MRVVRSRSRQIALATLFGVTIVVFKLVLPFPVDKFLLTFIQGTLLAMASLLVGLGGATYVSIIYGGLTAFLRPTTGLTIFVFALLYGLLVDATIRVFHAQNTTGAIKLLNLIAALVLSSSIVGLSSYSVSVYLEIIPSNSIVMLATLITGLITGIVASVLVKRIIKILTRRLSA